MLTYFLIGAAIGAATGIPIGPVNVAVIDAAYRHNLRRAIAVGLGGAFADWLYAFLGVVGVGPLVTKYEIVPPILYGISGLVLIVYGLLTVRSRPIDTAAQPAEVENSARHWWSGFFLGVALIFMNPGTLVTWVLIVGTYFAGASFVDGTGLALGIGAGSFVWFAFVAWLADKGKQLLGSKAIWITRVIGLGLVGFGLFSLGRSIYMFMQL